MRWINWQGGFARIPDSKTGPKTIPLPRPALVLLSKLREQQNHDGIESKFVLPGVRRGTYFTGIQKPWGRIRAAAGLEDVRIHDSKHCYANAHLALQPVREVAERAANRLGLPDSWAGPPSAT